MTRPVRFALIGCGRIAPRHIDAIAALEGAELAAVCDIDPDARASAASRTGAPTFSSMEALLAEVTPDVVSLATPSGLHPEQGLFAAKHGCHVITEKPMATSWRAARSLVDGCRENGVELFVVKQHRFHPAVSRVRRAIEQRRFGRIYAANLNLFWSRPQSYYDMADWRGTWSLDGGALMNQAIHYIDLLRWFVGPIASVYAESATLARDIEVEDTAVATLRWRSGALGTICTTMLAEPSNFEGSITIVGEKGRVRLGGLACNRIEAWEFDSPRPEDAEILDFAHDSTSIYGPGHTPFYENVLQTIRGETRPEIDGDEALRTLAVVVAAYQSAAEGRRVAVVDH